MPEEPVRQAKLGEIVHYKLTEDERADILSTGLANDQIVLPAIVVGVFNPNCVNIKVIFDGNPNDQWKTSVLQGTVGGTWSFVP
jgi:hypothetical protein